MNSIPHPFTCAYTQCWHDVTLLNVEERFDMSYEYRKVLDVLARTKKYQLYEKIEHLTKGKKMICHIAAEAKLNILEKYEDITVYQAKFPHVLSNIEPIFGVVGQERVNEVHAVALFDMWGQKFLTPKPGTVSRECSPIGVTQWKFLASLYNEPLFGVFVEKENGHSVLEVRKYNISFHESKIEYVVEVEEQKLLPRTVFPYYSDTLIRKELNQIDGSTLPFLTKAILNCFHLHDNFCTSNKLHT